MPLIESIVGPEWGEAQARRGGKPQVQHHQGSLAGREELFKSTALFQDPLGAGCQDNLGTARTARSLPSTFTTAEAPSALPLPSGGMNSVHTEGRKETAEGGVL